MTKPRLDRDARREAILDVAQEVFLEEGFAAASMSTIAARLGGSKGTLYNYFKNKEDLFNAYVERRCVWQHDETFAVQLPDESPAQALHRLGSAYLLHVFTDLNLRNFRLIVAEAERSPEIGRTFYETGPMRGVELVAELMTSMAQAGDLDIDDPVMAAHQFVGLVQNRYFKARLCNAIPELTSEQIEEEATLATRAFLRAFGARPATEAAQSPALAPAPLAHEVHEGS
jgi:AcrR family transcriptional regulator